MKKYQQPPLSLGWKKKRTFDVLPAARMVQKKIVPHCTLNMIPWRAEYISKPYSFDVCLSYYANRLTRQCVVVIVAADNDDNAIAERANFRHLHWNGYMPLPDIIRIRWTKCVDLDDFHLTFAFNTSLLLALEFQDSISFVLLFSSIFTLFKVCLLTLQCVRARVSEFVMVYFLLI